MLSAKLNIIFKKIQKNSKNSKNLFCYHCKNKVEVGKRLFFRKRILQLFYKDFIFQKLIFLCIFKCSHCNRAFTNYPTGLMPYKRFFVYSMLKLCIKYLNYSHISYRKSVLNHKNLPYFYDLDDADNVKSLSHTSIFRWNCYFAKCVNYVKEIQKVYILEGKSLEKPLITISPQKYKTNDMKTTLLISLENCNVIINFLKNYFLTNLQLIDF